MIAKGFATANDALPQESIKGSSTIQWMLASRYEDEACCHSKRQWQLNSIQP
jgi:hypothetical protein